ncbi:MAG: hypothetical protein J6R18_02925, partial [Kiritimatiellae bacterium]|nr:hypothetical protein [Kiritimatiellia bacterium]
TGSGGSPIFWCEKRRTFFRAEFLLNLAPFVFLCITRLRHSPLAKSGYKKSASFPTRLRLGFGGCSFMDFSLVCYWKTLPTLAGRGESETDKLKSFR